VVLHIIYTFVNSKLYSTDTFISKDIWASGFNKDLLQWWPYTYYRKWNRYTWLYQFAFPVGYSKWSRNLWKICI